MSWGQRHTENGLMSNEVKVQNIAANQTINAKDATALCDAVKSAVNDSRSIVNYGEVYQWYGRPPKDDFTLINPPHGILEHYVKDMTIKVCAGTRLKDLQTALAQENQWLPIDGVDADTQIGEMVAHQANGRLRSGYGTFRDLLLGLSYVNAQGELIEVGGRTVKNVAGYDVTRFMVGNANTAGLIHDLTLRTWSRPPAWMKLTLDRESIKAFDQIGTALISGDSNPVALNYEHNPNHQHTQQLIIGYEGHEVSCNTQKQALETLLNNHLQRDVNLQSEMISHDDWYESLCRRGAEIWNSNTLMKIVIPSNQTVRAIKELDNAPVPIEQIEAQPLFGTIIIGGNWQREQAIQLTKWVTDMIKQQGFLVWLKRAQDDTECQTVIPRPDDWDMIHKIIKQLDPQNIFNPGRLY